MSNVFTVICFLFLGPLADVETPFTVDAKSLATHGGDHVHGKLVGPSGQAVPVEVSDNKDGTYEAKYTPIEQGRSFVESCARRLTKIVSGREGSTPITCMARP